MKADEIRAMRIEGGCADVAMLREIAAQLAEIRDALQDRQPASEPKPWPQGWVKDAAEELAKNDAPASVVERCLNVDYLAWAALKNATPASVWPSDLISWNRERMRGRVESVLREGFKALTEAAVKMSWAMPSAPEEGESDGSYVRQVLANAEREILP